MNKVKMVLVDVNNYAIKEVDVEPTLDNYYDLLNCDIIDIVDRKIGDGYYSIICDDEGLLKSDYRISSINKNKEPMLVGNLLITKHNYEGEDIGLTEDEAYQIMHGGNIGMAFTLDNPDGYEILVCEY